jgi:hypothetical protein
MYEESRRLIDERFVAAVANGGKLDLRGVCAHAHSVCVAHVCASATDKNVDAAGASCVADRLSTDSTVTVAILAGTLARIMASKRIGEQRRSYMRLRASGQRTSLATTARELSRTRFA